METSKQDIFLIQLPLEPENTEKKNLKHFFVNGVDIWQWNKREKTHISKQQLIKIQREWQKRFT